MSRLFWKFFLSLMLAQVMTTAVVVSLIFTNNPLHKHEWRIESKSALSDLVQRPVSNKDSLRESMRRPPTIPGGPLIVGVFTSLLFAFFLARYFSKPIEGLRRGFTELGSGNFDYQLDPSTINGRKDELAELCRYFNNTASRLKALVEGQKRLLHDVSHEVRSPLARMQLAIDLLEKQPERQHDLVERIARESNRISVLIDSVLTLARLETGVQWSLDESVDLAELISAVACDVRFEAEQKPCTILWAKPVDAAFVHGNTELLHRAFENIMRNAIRYTRPGTTVLIQLDKAPTNWIVTISDCGPGIPESLMTQSFEPFKRLQENKLSKDGYGLGLAIAAQTLKMHLGSLSLRNIYDSSGIAGLQATLTIPEI